MKNLIFLFILLAAAFFAIPGRATTYTPTISSDPAVSGGVNSANGVITGGAGNGQVSLRSAVIAANAHAGFDTITLGNGTYTLTISSGGTFENAALSGDLDINDSVAITGNGPGNTVITTTYDATCGDGKVFGVNQDGSHNGLNVSFTGLTIQNGFNNGVNFQGTFFETGGGVDFYLTGAGGGALYAMTNCVVANCVTTNSAQCHGGGVNVDSTGAATVGGASVGNAYFVNCVFSNNVSMHEGAGLCLHADKHDVTVTGCTFVKNRGESGGGLLIEHSFGGTVTVNNCSSISNTVTAGGGGGVFIGYNTSVSLANSVIAGNSATGGTSTGGGLLISELGLAGFTASINVNSCTITNNHADGVSAAGGGVYYDHAYSATLNNCVISANTAKTGAGAMNGGVSSTPPDTLTILNSTFSGNVASGNGGAFYNSSPASITTLKQCIVTGNSAASGGAFYVNGGLFTNTFSRVVSNNATTGRAVTQVAGTATVTNNWWGTNAPAALMSGTVGFTPWLQLTHTAGPNTIFVPNSTTLTASFLTNSAGTFIPVSNLGLLVGLPITFSNPMRGTLSSAQTAIQASGTATVTFTANAAGAGSADATVDNQTTTASITIPTGVSSINRAQTSPTNLNSVQWTVTFTNAVSGVVAGNFSLINTGLGGSPGITSVTAVGGAPATQWTVTASTGSGTGTLGLNMVNGTAVSAVIVNLPFTGQVYTLDLVAPDTSITAQPASLTNSASASFSFTGSDTGTGVASFQYQLDGGSYTTAASPVNLSSLSSAAHTFNVRAIDGAGNIDASPATVTWTVDTIPPVVNCSTDITVIANGYCPPTVNYSVSISDNLAIALATTNPASGSIFPLGTNTVTLTAKDTAGNTNFCTFKVIVSPGAAPLLNIVRNSTNVVVSWSNSYPCYTFQFAPLLASNSWSTYPGPFATNNGKIFVTNNAPLTNRFFRLKF